MVEIGSELHDDNAPTDSQDPGSCEMQGREETT